MRCGAQKHYHGHRPAIKHGGSCYGACNDAKISHGEPALQLFVSSAGVDAAGQDMADVGQDRQGGIRVWNTGQGAHIFVVVAESSPHTHGGGVVWVAYQDVEAICHHLQGSSSKLIRLRTAWPSQTIGNAVIFSPVYTQIVAGTVSPGCCRCCSQSCSHSWQLSCRGPAPLVYVLV